MNIHVAKTQLSRLIEAAQAGEDVIIARAGKPVARLVSVNKVDQEPRRLGGLEGRFKIPDDFDTMLADEIADLFEAR